MTTAHPHVPNQLVLSLFEDHAGDIFSCAKCGKYEPPDVDFASCGRCNAAVYCSKSCQVDHWKKHKRNCPKFDGDESKKAYKKMDGRLCRFNGYFAPIVSKILAVKLALLKLDDGAATNETHLVTMRFSELPDDAKRPRLRLEDVGTVALADLLPEHQSRIRQGFRMHPPGIFVIPSISMVDFSCGLFTKPGMTAFEANPLLDGHMPKRRADLTVEGNAWIRVINDIAEGRRNDLRRAIKGRIVRNQARG